MWELYNFQKLKYNRSRDSKTIFVFYSGYNIFGKVEIEK
jgi:hypothetical protein